MLSAGIITVKSTCSRWRGYLIIYSIIAYKHVTIV